MTHYRLAVSSKALRLLATLLPAAPLGATEMDSRVTRSATRPAAIAAPLRQGRGGQGGPGVSLPPAFATLMKRSIFAKNGIAAVPPGTNPGPPEAMFALRGIVFDDTSFLAFIEDTGSHRTMQLKPGDSVAGGKIGQITVDDVAYEMSGKLTQVRVGQNLLGMMVPPVPVVPKPAAAAPGGPQEGPPPGVKPPPGPIYDIGPNGQRVRNLAKERAGE